MLRLLRSLSLVDHAVRNDVLRLLTNNNLLRLFLVHDLLRLLIDNLLNSKYILCFAL